MKICANRRKKDKAYTAGVGGAFGTGTRSQAEKQAGMRAMTAAQKLAHEEAEREKSEKEKDRDKDEVENERKADNFHNWMIKIINCKLKNPLQIALLNKIIDMKPIDGNSDQANNDLLPKLYELFFDWPKPKTVKQIEE